MEGGVGGGCFRTAGERTGNREAAVKEVSFSRFGSEVAVVVALARPAAVVAPLPVPVPPVLPALPPALVVVAAVTAGSPSWPGGRQRGRGNIY